MIGFKFLIVGSENKPINHGTIIEKVTEGKYLCQFKRVPTSCRVVDVAEIEGWNLFPTDDGMNEFIASLQKKPDDTIPNGTTPPAPPPPGGPKPNPRARKIRAKRNGKKAKKSKNGK